jgi:hypothetical protein
MEIEKFLEKWYNIKRTNCVENDNYINLSLNLYPGNLQKILNKLRTIGHTLNTNSFINKHFYSYKKEVYIQTSFFYFEFVCYIINRINKEIEYLYCTGTSNAGNKNNYPDIRELFIKKDNKLSSSLLYEIGEFWNNGNIKLRLFHLNKEDINISDKLYIDEIINDGYIMLLNNIEDILEGNSAILTESLVVKDKKTGIKDFKINLNFYIDKVNVITENPFNIDLKSLEDIKIEDSNYKKNISKSINISSSSINEIKDSFIKQIKRDIYNLDLFKLETDKKDFKIKSVENDNGFSINSAKIIINNGYISLEEFKEIVNDLKYNETYSKLLLEAIE